MHLPILYMSPVPEPPDKTSQAPNLFAWITKAYYTLGSHFMFDNKKNIFQKNKSVALQYSVSGH